MINNIKTCVRIIECGDSVELSYQLSPVYLSSHLIFNDVNNMRKKKRTNSYLTITSLLNEKQEAVVSEESMIVN